MPLKAEKPTDLLPPSDTAPMARHADVAPIDMQELFRSAIAQGSDGAAALEKLVELKHRMDDRQAEKDFAMAMAAFQAECPPIRKNTEATVVHKAGGQHKYNYAELPELCCTIKPFVEKHGFSYGWNTGDSTPSELMCVCIVRHVNGHKEFTRFPCPIDTAAKMSGAQKSGSALTYAKRQSLIAAFGITTCDPDDDGAGGTAAHEPVNDIQFERLDTLMQTTGASVEGFLGYFDIKQISDLPQNRFAEAMRMLGTKRRQKA